MKNIHLIPTDKPSRLFKVSGELKLTRNFDFYNGSEYQHIYITSDEKIKERDWVFNFEYDYIVQYDSKKHDNKFWYKKIILTTDQDLIKDSVQAIDDTFLEWFVKNPSCESVEVCKNPFYEESNYEYYKIIIPKEEPKQYPIGGYAPGYYSCTCITCKKEFTGDKRAVQCEPCAIKMTETLEEAADIERIAMDKLKNKWGHLYTFGYPQRPFPTNYENDLNNIKIGLYEGAKYQAERMYSEEEVLELIWKYETRQTSMVGYSNVKKWFEQFKKK
jgi:hypothetical protein